MWTFDVFFSASLKQVVEQTVQLPVIWDAMTFMRHYCNISNKGVSQMRALLEARREPKGEPEQGHQMCYMFLNIKRSIC